MFSCEYCEIFKNSFFIEHLQWRLLQWKDSQYFSSKCFKKYEENIWKNYRDLEISKPFKNFLQKGCCTQKIYKYSLMAHNTKLKLVSNLQIHRLWNVTIAVIYSHHYNHRICSYLILFFTSTITWEKQERLSVWVFFRFLNKSLKWELLSEFLWTMISQGINCHQLPLILKQFSLEGLFYVNIIEDIVQMGSGK